MKEDGSASYAGRLRSEMERCQKQDFPVPNVADTISAGIKTLKFIPTDNDDWAYKFLSGGLPTAKTVFYDGIIKSSSAKKMLLDFKNRSMGDLIGVLRDSGRSLLLEFIDRYSGPYEKYIPYIQYGGSAMIRYWENRDYYKSGDAAKALEDKVAFIKAEMPSLIKETLAGLWGITYDMDISKINEIIQKNTGLSYDQVVELVKGCFLLLTLEEPIKQLSTAMKNLWQTQNEYWQGVANGFKQEYYIIKDTYFSSNGMAIAIKYLLNMLIPIIGKLAAACNMHNKCMKKMQEEAESAISRDCAADGEDGSIIDRREGISSIVDDAVRNFNLYGISGKSSASVSYASPQSQDDSSGQPYCSICYVPGASNDASEGLYTSPLFVPSYTIVEIGKDISSYSLLPSVGDRISYNDYLGRIGDVSFFSILSGTVQKREERYFIMKEDSVGDASLLDGSDEDIEMSATAAADMLVPDISSDMKANRALDIIDGCSQLYYRERFIMDYLLHCRYAEFALNVDPDHIYYTDEIGFSSGKDASGNPVSTPFKFKKKHHKRGIPHLSDTWQDYIDNLVTPMEKRHKDAVKKINSSTNVSSKAKDGKTVELMNDIMKEKSAFVSDVMSIYSSTPNSSYYCEGYCDIVDTDEKTEVDKEDWFLFGDYEYFLDDVFEYDEGDSFSTTLFNLISDFMKRRMSLEPTSKKSLIKSFNSLCSKLGGDWPVKYFSGNSPDYYSAMEVLFPADYYISDTGYDVRASTKDDSSTSLYQRMYDFLSYVKGGGSLDEMQSVDCDLSTQDISTFVKNNSSYDNGTKSSKDNAKVKALIRKICRKYIFIKKYATDGIAEDAGKDALYSELIYERDSIRSLLDSVCADYDERKSLDVAESLKELGSVAWPPYSIIYIDNVPHKHYLFSLNSLSGTTADDGTIGDQSIPATEEEMDSESCPKTKKPFGTYGYWLIYCAEATLVGAMLPYTWGAGIVVSGVPTYLPIIYIPIYFLSTSCSILFGLGICGMTIYPMMVFYNMTDNYSTTIPMVNLSVDAIRKVIERYISSADAAVGDVTAFQIRKVERSIANLERESESIDDEINKLETYLESHPIKDEAKMRRAEIRIKNQRIKEKCIRALENDK